MPANFNDAFFEQNKAIRNALYEMDAVANALSNVGLDKVAKRLSKAAANLDNVSADTMDAYQEKIGQDTAIAEQNTRNLLTALTAGVEIGKNDERE